MTNGTDTHEEPRKNGSTDHTGLDYKRLTLNTIAKKVWRGGYGNRNAEGAIKYIAEELTDKIIDRHLSPDRSISVYLVAPGASTTQVGVIDVDDHEQRFSPIELNAVVKRIQASAKEFKVICNVVQSGGGRGRHLWMLWDKPHPVTAILGLLREILDLGGFKQESDYEFVDTTEIKIEIFPKVDGGVPVDGLSAPPIALPFARASIPLDHDTLEPRAEPILWATCGVPPEAAVPIAEAAGRGPKANWSVELVTDMLSHVAPDSKQQRTRVGMALKHSSCPLKPEESFEIWRTWLKRSDKFKDLHPNEKWNKTFKIRTGKKTVTFGTAIWLAKEGGWVPPDGLFEKKEKQAKAPPYRTAVDLMRTDPRWDGVLAYNEFSSHPILLKAGPDEFCRRNATYPHLLYDDDVRALMYGLQGAGVDIGKAMSNEALWYMAEQNSFHPVRQYFETLKWDGVSRIDTWLIDHLGCADTAFVRAVGSRWLIGAVARIMKPGCLMKTVLWLEGPQDLGKSKAVKTLAVQDDWFTDHVSELGKKDSREETQGRWIIEFAEFAGMSKVEGSRLKAFLSTTTDHFRPSYGTHARDYPRQWVGVVTFNPGAIDPFDDETGAVRFWPVTCGIGWKPGREVDTEALKKARDQLWAEAAVAYAAGKEWWLNDTSLREAQKIAAEERSVTDSREHIVQRYLKDREWTQVHLVLEQLDIPRDRQDKRIQIDVGKMMARLRWRKWRNGDFGPNIEDGGTGAGTYYFPSEVNGVNDYDRTAYAHEVTNRAKTVAAEVEARIKASRGPEPPPNEDYGGKGYKAHLTR